MGSLRILALSLLLAGCTTLGGAPAPGSPEFARVQQGMTRDDARRLLGAPIQTMAFPNTRTEAWDYPYQDPWGYIAIFSVVFGPEGSVVGTLSTRINDGGDHGK